MANKLILILKFGFFGYKAFVFCFSVWFFKMEFNSAMFTEYQIYNNRNWFVFRRAQEAKVFRFLTFLDKMAMFTNWRFFLSRRRVNTLSILVTQWTQNCSWSTQLCLWHYKNFSLIVPQACSCICKQTTHISL